MSLCEKIGRDDVSGNDLFLLSISGPQDLPDDIPLSTPGFVCLLAWDARTFQAGEISSFARRLLDAGAVYVCAWGPDCERVHDIIDQESVGPNPPAVVDSVVMTSWHADEPLAEALWCALIAIPDDAYAGLCGSTLAIAVGSARWAAEIRDAFTRPDSLYRQSSGPPR